MKKEKLGPLREVYSGILFKILQRDVSFSDGTTKLFEYCVRPNSVTILPFDSKGRLLLIRERRHGYDKDVWFLPAGKVDEGESPMQAAKRELREETGFGARVVKKIYEKSPSPTLHWDIHIYAAKDLYMAPLTGDEENPIKVVPTPFSKALQMALDGTIKNEFISFHIIKFNYMIKHGQFKW
ncbi:MAG: NUDIX hydrolase [Candidatus Magasanikbacteria bacterium]|nr:NUDIX hydrolase [Candidatus Magasanikbacteria bacterium]